MGSLEKKVVPNEEHEFQEGTDLDSPVLACALGVFTGTEAEVEPQLDQVGNIPGLGSETEDAVATLEWIMSKGVAFSRLTGGTLIP